MQITSIQITRRENTGTKLKATVSIVLDDMVVIHDIKVLDNAGTLFLAMPSKPTKMNTFKDVVHPINQEVRGVFEQLILGSYKNACANNYSRIELRFHQNDTIGLLEQTCEMFEVTSKSVFSTQAGGNTDYISPKESRVQHGSTKAADVTNDDLLKWLES